MKEDLFQAMAQSIVEGEAEEAERLARQAIEQSIEPVEELLTKVMWSGWMK
jgi:methanogenic corrinoid protein MtbC1